MLYPQLLRIILRTKNVYCEAAVVKFDFCPPLTYNRSGKQAVQVGISQGSNAYDSR